MYKWHNHTKSSICKYLIVLLYELIQTFPPRSQTAFTVSYPLSAVALKTRTHAQSPAISNDLVSSAITPEIVLQGPLTRSDRESPLAAHVQETMCSQLGVCVCVCACTCICVHMCVCVCVCICMYVCACALMCVHACTRMCVCARTYVYVYLGTPMS